MASTNSVPKPRQPTPEEFGITAARVKHFRRILNDDPFQLAAIGLATIGAILAAWNWLLSFLFPRLPYDIGVWLRLVPPITIAVFLTGALQRWRKSNAMRQRDYPNYTSFRAALQDYESALRTYHYLQREERYAEARRKRRQDTLLYEQRMAKWTDIGGRDFEIEVVKILFSKGYDVEHTGRSRSGDEGVDFVVRFGDKRIIGQCKAHKAYLSAGFVRELYGTLLHQKADEAWLVGTTGFYSGAKAFASGKPIRLLTIHELLRLPNAERAAGTRPGGKPTSTHDGLNSFCPFGAQGSGRARRHPSRHQFTRCCYL